jgi:hypothetical protein
MVGWSCRSHALVAVFAVAGLGWVLDGVLEGVEAEAGVQHVE